MSRQKHAAVREHGGQRERSGANHSHPLPHSSALDRQPQPPRHGRITGTAWTKKVSGSRHKMRRPSGWALDVSDVLAATHCGADEVQLHDLETGITYSASIRSLLEQGQLIDYGFGRQILLPIDCWRTSAYQSAPRRPSRDEGAS